MKPKRLVVVRFRQDRWKWAVDHANLPGAHPARSRPLFATEAEPTEYAAKMVKRLEAGAPATDDPNITLERAFERYFRLKARKRSLAEGRRLAEHPKKEFGKDERLKDLATQPGRIAAYKERRFGVYFSASQGRRREGDAAVSRKHQPTRWRFSVTSCGLPTRSGVHYLRCPGSSWNGSPRGG